MSPTRKMICIERERERDPPSPAEAARNFRACRKADAEQAKTEKTKDCVDCRAAAAAASLLQRELITAARS